MEIIKEKVFFILDLDRTLVKTDELFRLFREAVVENGSIPIESFDEGERKYQHTFDVVAYTRRLLGALYGADSAEERLSDIYKRFMRHAEGADVWEPYAQELISELREKGKTFGIMTKGGQEWQQFKLEASGFAQIPRLITSNARKAEIIASWYGPEGGFTLPEVLSPAATGPYDKMVLLDDKAISFADMPPGVFGVLVRPLSGSTKELEEETSETGVIRVDGLKQARDILVTYKIL